MRSEVSPCAVLVAAHVKNALDRGHFEVNQYAGRIKLNEQDGRVGDVARRFGLFMASPGDGWTYVWLPMYWDKRGARHTPSMVTDSEYIGGMVGTTKDTAWSTTTHANMVPLYTEDTHAALKRAAMEQLTVLLPRAPPPHDVARGVWCC
jgi:hypothetical protein